MGQRLHCLLHTSLGNVTCQSHIPIRINHPIPIKSTSEQKTHVAGSHVQDAQQQLAKEDTSGETRWGWLVGCRKIFCNIVIVTLMLMLVPIFICPLKTSLSKQNKCGLAPTYVMLAQVHMIIVIGAKCRSLMASRHSSRPTLHAIPEHVVMWQYNVDNCVITRTTLLRMACTQQYGVYERMLSSICFSYLGNVKHVKHVNLT